MSEPPLLLDGARVLEYALLDAGASAGRRSVVAEGVPFTLDTGSRLAIAEDLAKGGVYLLHCNPDWETLVAAPYADVESARESAQSVYTGIDVHWTPYRELTPAEVAEVETTRAFLKEIIAEFPVA
jgi:hypothetical protein